MANAQNINALSMHVTQLATSVAALQSRPFVESEGAIDRTLELSFRFASLNANDLTEVEDVKLGELLNDAADIEVFPFNALQLARKKVAAKDAMIRIGCVRVLILAGTANDKKRALSAIESEQNAFARKMMESALGANAR